MGTQSGTSKPRIIPVMLPHPEPFTDTALVSGMLCYVVKYYQNAGISCLISHNKNGEVAVTMGDWNGNILDLTNIKDSLTLIAVDFLKSQASRLIAISNAAGVKQAIYYFAIDTGIPVLVDIRLSLNKFLGPGMIRDVFGKTYDTQMVLKIDVMSEQILEQINDKAGLFESGAIIKPSRFRYMEKEDKQIPLYVGTQC
jgi:hypothetical protein